MLIKAIKSRRYIDCASCFKEKIVVLRADTPDGLVLFDMYKDGWTYCNDLWYCRDCRPEKLKIDPSRHPHYTNYLDEWGDRPEKLSHDFEDEPYDPYARLIRHDMCNCCEYMKLGYEDDGSSWRMCMVDDLDISYGHNLYSGHFYGDAIEGRLCPYFTCRHIRGRNPVKDKRSGIFHVPYNERYDGD